MTKRIIPAHCVIIKQHNRVILQDIKDQFIKVLSTHVQAHGLKLIYPVMSEMSIKRVKISIVVNVTNLSKREV